MTGNDKPAPAEGAGYVAGDASTRVARTSDSAVRTEPFQVMPALSADEYIALRDDIANNGVRQPIDVDQHGRILDGHHRARVCAELGIHPPTRVVKVASGAEARAHAFATNTTRRQLDREQRRQVVTRSLTDDPHLSDRQHAARCGTSPTTVGRLRAVLIATGQLSKLDSRLGADGRERACRTVWQSPSPELLTAALAGAGLTAILPMLETIPSPGMDQDGWDAFCDSIREHGVREPILTKDGLLVDGRSRLMAGALTGQPVPRHELGELNDPNNWCHAYNVELPRVRLGFPAELGPDEERPWRRLAGFLNSVQDRALAIGYDTEQRDGMAAAHQVLHDACSEYLRSLEAEYAGKDEFVALMSNLLGRVVLNVAELFNPDAPDPEAEELGSLRAYVQLREPNASGGPR